MNDVSS